MSVEKIVVPFPPELLAELQSCNTSDEGYTRTELRQAWKCGEKLASKYLRMAQQAGILRTGWRISADISGRPNRIPVYSFLEQKKARKR
jgi:hypothetical protein